ncbi:terpene synthase family protein [Coleofasciculus sp. G3-WIS-01]|uniref:terpene synthase family protein n=1 Tax=Coleofasciculus sp. G3-WIS-01 TaxID=3069528 RepID=UPI004062B94B
MTSSQPTFELPDFYMPWPARVNPNVQGARIHCKEWAYRMGILGSDEDAVWDEKTFDAMDFAGFAAATHPDAPALELDLLSDWYVWGWFADDYFAKTFEVGNQDVRQAKSYIDRVMSFMATDLSTPLPEPKNPTERALIDLWFRSAPTMSQQWRQRFVEHYRTLSYTALRELFNQDKNQERIIDPVEYVMLRRQVSGMFWSADLVEHSLAAEIPAEIYNKRPIRVLKDIFCDSVALRNDIISYQKDIDEGRSNNCVMVAEHFFNTEIQDAVNFVNDLVTSRLFQFEHTMTVELPPLLDEYGLDSEARYRVFRYVKALQDWMAGDLEWETRPGGRYIPAGSKKESPLAGPKGLGTAAARIGLSPAAMGLRVRTYNYIPFQTVGEIPLPEFYMPFSTGLNPHLEEGRRTSKEWAYEMGMIGIPGISFWDEQRFDAIDAALTCALVYPKAAKTVYELATKGMVWGFYLDCVFDGRYLATRDIVGGRVFLARLLALISSDSGPMLMPTNPSERGLVYLWQRMTSCLSAEDKEEMRGLLVKIFESWAWQLDHQAQNRIPDPIDYVETRIKTFGFDFLMLLNQSEKMPPELYDSQPVQSMHKAGANVSSLVNDIVSYQKEMESEGILFNSVLITQHFLDCDVAKAVEIVNNLITARVREFEHIVATELPALCEDFDLDTRAREQLFEYVEQLQFMMSGMLKWHLGGSYYKEPEFKRDPSPRNLFNAPTALGCSAARITSLLSSVGIPQLGTEAEPVAETLPSLPTGLGTSAMQIAASLAETPQPETEAEPVAESLPSLPTGLGTSAMQISSMLETGLTHKRHLW